MRGRKLHLLFGAVLMSLLVALPLVSGCAREEAAPPPEVEKYVTFLSLSDLTGPGAGFVAPVCEGIGFGLDDLNDRGGVDGIKVKMITVDTRYDVARTTSAYKRYRGEHKIGMVFIPLTGAVKALGPSMEADGLISMTPADGEFQAHIGRVFLAVAPYQDGCSASFDWMAEGWKAKGNPGMPTVGYLFWDNPYGREPLRGGKEYAEEIGINLLEPEFFPTGTVDHSVWLTRIAEAGADYCYIGGVGPTQSLVLRDAHKLGLTKTIQFVSDYWGLDETLGVRLHPEACEGSVLCTPVARGDEAFNHPRVADFWTKYADRPITEMRALHPAGIVIARMFEQAIKIALEDVGYDKLDGEAMYQAYQKLTGFDTEDITGPCAYSPTSRKGTDMVKFYRVESGKVVPITDWVKAPDAVSRYPGW